ncbi:MAG: M48 family metalloprotease, partial [Congregibacter sp.]|nr:M48 family metalloprotease [Congregibacter sp.]
PFARAFIYVPIYALVTTVLLFPLSCFRDFYTEHKFGLATQSFSSWFGDFIIEGLVTTVLFALFVGLLYMVIRRTRDNWWAWGSGLSIGFMLFALFISPVFIDPLFNEYRPMDEGPLKERILSIARANGMQTDDVKQVDASRQTNRVSANVSGLFGTARIALNDNLLNRADADSVEAVMAHEIGHYVLNHPIKMMLALLPILLAIFFLTNLIFRAVLRSKGEDWGVRGIDDYAGFPMLMAIFTVVGLLATPVFQRVVYMQEYEADLFAINATQNPDAWAKVALLTAEYRKLEPSDFEENWFNHHPSPYMRIYMAMRWKAEHLPPN